MAYDDRDVPEPLQRIIARTTERSENKDPLASHMPALCTLSFVWARAEGDWVTLAELWAEGPIPIPAKGEIIQLHEEYVRVADVRTQYDLAEHSVKGRTEVFTIIWVEPASDPGD